MIQARLVFKQADAKPTVTDTFCFFGATSSLTGDVTSNIPQVAAPYSCGPCRQNGFGCCSFVARMASSLAPLIMLLDDTWKYLPPLIFSVVAVLCGLVAFLLPETTNIRLPETIEDVEDDR